MIPIAYGGWIWWRHDRYDRLPGLQGPRLSPLCLAVQQAGAVPLVQRRRAAVREMRGAMTASVDQPRMTQRR